MQSQARKESIARHVAKLDQIKIQPHREEGAEIRDSAWQVARHGGGRRRFPDLAGVTAAEQSDADSRKPEARRILRRFRRSLVGLSRRHSFFVQKRQFGARNF